MNNNLELTKLTLIDCTLRDGGYYNNWNFSQDLVERYLNAMDSAGISVVELGFRSLETKGFKGPCAYTTDDYIRSLEVPENMDIGVMVNASDLINFDGGAIKAIQRLFVPADKSPVKLVRIACHLHEFEATISVCSCLKEMGYMIGLNLMQVADRTDTDLCLVGEIASKHELDVLYFADSLGSLTAERTSEIVRLLRLNWNGALGFHAHDNIGRALSNTLQAIESGVTWVDGTVTGMGRGPGNVQTEYLLIELAERLRSKPNSSGLFSIIKKDFRTMQFHYGWGTNPYYYLAGKAGIHPTYVQEMMSDPRYGEEDILAVLDYLKKNGGKKFSSDALEAGRQMYGGEPTGSWAPAATMANRDVLILGAGPGVEIHREALQRYVKKDKPVVIALNTQTVIDAELIHLRIACHPVRLIADCDQYPVLGQSLVAPFSRLPEELKKLLQNNSCHDYGLAVDGNDFEFYETGARIPTSLVIAYAMAMANSGKANKIYLAGFDGYSLDDSRTSEMNNIFSAYLSSKGAIPVIAITPTQYKIPSTSVYAF